MGFDDSGMYATCMARGLGAGARVQKLGEGCGVEEREVPHELFEQSMPCHSIILEKETFIGVFPMELSTFLTSQNLNTAMKLVELTFFSKKTKKKKFILILR